MQTEGRVVRTMAPDGTAWSEAQWPGTSYAVRFQGTEVYFRVGSSHEMLHVVADQRLPLTLRDPQPGVYELTDLGRGSHNVRVEIVTESQKGPNRFGGFSLRTKERALPPVAGQRQIEFIGDSHTVGYGNTSPKTTCTTDEVWATTDTSAAFGPLVARYYDADVQINAISGRGIVRNYDGSAGPTLPEAYPFVLFDQKQRYVDPSWQPQLIVIALGTNDFSTELHAGEPWKDRDALHADYEATYLRFLHDLRTSHPRAFLLLWATGMAHGEIEAEVQRVVAKAQEAGEQRIAFLPIDDLQFTGCHGHPSLADDRVIAHHITQFVDTHEGEIWRPAQ